MKSKFDSWKADALNKYRAMLNLGDVDSELVPILEHINSLEDYYTTSSCAGRVVLFQDLGSKKDGAFLGKWHSVVGYDDVKSALKPCRGLVWLKYEPAILHIVARSLDKAKSMIEIGLKAGFKKTGLQVIKPQRYVIEIASTERVDVPVMDDCRTLITEDYFRFIVELSNRKFQGGHVRLKRLKEKLESKLY